MKSETGERIQTGRTERVAGTIDGDSVSFCSKVSAVEVFCMAVCNPDGRRTLLFDPKNEKLCKIAKERVQQLTSPGREA
jgi:hypothetical protein